MFVVGTLKRLFFEKVIINIKPLTINLIKNRVIDYEYNFY